MIGQGIANPRTGRRADAATVYEIGSLAKLYTALLSADMVDKGEVQAADSLAHYLSNPAFTCGRQAGMPTTAWRRRSNRQAKPHWPRPTTGSRWPSGRSMRMRSSALAALAGKDARPGAG
ncbi:MAG: serine hydrolase [Pseudomonadota bacterium]